MATRVGHLPCGVCKHPNSLAYSGGQCQNNECFEWDGIPPLRYRLRLWYHMNGKAQPPAELYRDNYLESMIEQDDIGLVDKFGRVSDVARCLRCNHLLDTLIGECPRCRTCAGNPTLRMAIWHYMLNNGKRTPPPAWYAKEVSTRMDQPYTPQVFDEEALWRYAVNNNLGLPRRYYELKSEMAAPAPTDGGSGLVLQHPKPIRTNTVSVLEVDSRAISTAVTNAFQNRENEAPQSLGVYRAFPDDQQQHSGLYNPIYADSSKTSAKQGQTSASEHLGMGSSSCRQQQPSATCGNLVDQRIKSFAQVLQSEQPSATTPGSRTNVPFQSQSNCGESRSAANFTPLSREQACKMHPSPAIRLPMRGAGSLAPTYIPADPKPAHNKDICSWKPPAALPQNFHLEGSVQAPGAGEWRVAQSPGVPDSMPCGKCRRHTPRTSAMMPEMSSR